MVEVQNRPHGNMVCLPFILTMTAYILASTGNYWCNFVYRNEQTANGVTTSRGLGLWSFEGYDGNCYYYPNNFQPDTKLKSARAFNILSTTIGMFCLLMISCSGCIPFSRGSWGCTGVYLVLCSLFVGLTLLFKQSELCLDQITYSRSGVTYQWEGGCSLNYGAKCAIAAIVFFFLAGCSVFSVPPPEMPIREPQRVKETVVTTEEVRPDGTKVTTTNTTYTDV